MMMAEKEETGGQMPYTLYSHSILVNNKNVKGGIALVSFFFFNFIFLSLGYSQFRRRLMTFFSFFSFFLYIHQDHEEEEGKGAEEGC